MIDAPLSKSAVFATRVRFSSAISTSEAILLLFDTGSQQGYFSFTEQGYFYVSIQHTDNIYSYIATSDEPFLPNVWYSVLCKLTFDTENIVFPLEVSINGQTIDMTTDAWDPSPSDIDWSQFDSWEVGNLNGTVVVDSRFIWFEPSLAAAAEPPSIPEYSDFFEANNCVKDLGADGSTPTGSQPMIYMTGGAVEFQDNKGYGGAFAGSSGTISSGTYTCP
jgi:hypothetical protein